MPFCLAINLRKESNKESLFNAKKVAKKLPEFEDK